MRPMTTVAKGRCTSAPVPVASAIEIKPSDATISDRLAWREAKKTSLKRSF